MDHLPAFGGYRSMTLTPKTTSDTASLATQSDEELLLRYRDTGDMAAFETLVHRYEKPLFNYLVRYLRNPSLAEEVFQGTFLRLHEKCHQFTPDRQVRPWLYSIATHLAIDALRKEGQQPTTSLDQQVSDAESDVGALLDILGTRPPTPLEQLEAQEQAEWARRAVDALPDPLRQVILLAYFQGLKFREVAEILQLPLGTVKSRLHKALAMLHAAWDKEYAGSRASS
jgi:RNA polymerase sigma-70 factor (ECF subfamily)